MMSFALIIIVLLVPIGLGVTLLILSGRGRRPFAACGGCGYDVSGSVGSVTRCPECGLNFGG